MSIVSTDIQFLLSGGSSNTDPNASLGGAISTTGITDNTSQNLFDNVTASQAASGLTEYRGFYGKNNHGSLTLGDARVYISQDTTSSSDEIDIAVATEGVSTSMATIANEGTAPSGITFSHPTTYSGGIQLNSTTGLAAGAYRGIWVRRTVNASAAAATGDNAIIKIEGTTT